MSALGISDWTPRYLLPKPWFDGAFLEFALQANVSFKGDDATVTAKTMAGTTIMQRAYQGAKSPGNKSPNVFTMPLLGDSQEEFEIFQRAQAGGEPVQFCAGFRFPDVFPFAVDGNTYTLTRPLAKSVIPDGPQFVWANYAETVWLNGTLSPSSASASGQTLTAADSGKIAIHYTPIHWVRVKDVSAALPTVNGLAVTVILEELIRGDFE